MQSINTFKKVFLNRFSNLEKSNDKLSRCQKCTIKIKMFLLFYYRNGRKLLSIMLWVPKIKHLSKFVPVSDDIKREYGLLALTFVVKKKIKRLTKKYSFLI